jgi:hypothetical protein
MARLTAARRSKLPASKFAGPNKSFPINDPTHARLAISGATRSERAGNISPGMAASIKSAAREKLGGYDDRRGRMPRDNQNTPGPAAPPVQSAMGNTGNPGPAGAENNGAGNGANGARDGLGHGKGGMALHPSMRAANAEGYERDHSSRTR